MTRALRVLCCLALACGGKSETQAGAGAGKGEVGSLAQAPVSFEGDWRFELDSPGGLLPFGVSISKRQDGSLAGVMINGDEELPFSRVEQKGDALKLFVDHYDSRLVAKRQEDGSLRGTWHRAAPKTPTAMKFKATPGAQNRFPAAPESEPMASVAGDWAMTFTEQDGSTFAGRALLKEEGGVVKGTILTDTGDYRFLEGRAGGGELALSVFDGAHAFLFRASLGDTSKSLKGDFWSRDSYHASFEAKAMGEGDKPVLGDPLEQVKLTSLDGRLHFDFPMLGGGQMSDADPSLEGKVVLVDIFGTWCPNCNDQAALLARWHAKYQSHGLEIVGIAFEFSGDEARDMEMLARYRDKYGITYPLLLGGTSDKKLAAEQLPDLSAVKSFPTLAFVDRNGKVQAIYSGFSGPATGARYGELLRAHEELIERLLGE